jgi:hypothetical protein
MVRNVIIINYKVASSLRLFSPNFDNKSDASLSNTQSSFQVFGYYPESHPIISIPTATMKLSLALVFVASLISGSSAGCIYDCGQRCGSCGNPSTRECWSRCLGTLCPE